MHIHELNPWRTLIVLSLFVVLLIIGFFTMYEPLLTFKKDMEESLGDLKKTDTYFYPWQLDSFINKQTQNIVLFDIRDKFVYGQGNIPGSENISAHDLALNESIKRLEELKEKNITVVLYGTDQLEANGPWMLFRQVGFDNVKVLLGGYLYYDQHKDNLAACKNDTTLLMGNPRYDFFKIASQTGGSVGDIESSSKKPVVVQRREKTNVVKGGC